MRRGRGLRVLPMLLGRGELVQQTIKGTEYEDGMIEGISLLGY